MKCFGLWFCFRVRGWHKRLFQCFHHVRCTLKSGFYFCYFCWRGHVRLIHRRVASPLCCTGQQQYQRALYSLWYSRNWIAHTCSALSQLLLHSQVPVTLSSLSQMLLTQEYQSNSKLDWFFLHVNLQPGLFWGLVCVFFSFPDLLVGLSVCVCLSFPSTSIFFSVELSCELNPPHWVNAMNLMCRSNCHLVCPLCLTQSSVT